jgi:pimeloyl-ACP methyl ester carboxylesterase
MPELVVNDLVLHYRDSGGEGSTPLVLLHGLGSSSKDWEFNFEALARKRRVIAPDLRGFGESARPKGPHTPSDYAADVLALLEALGIREFDLLGYSMGGAAAFQLAVDRPEVLRKLVLVNTSPTYETNDWSSRWEAFMRITLVRFVGMDQLARLIAKRLFPGEHQEALRATTRSRYGANDRASYLAAHRGLIGWSVSDQIPGIDLPTLVIAADQDYTPVSAKENYVETMSNASLVVVKNSRHGTPMDQAEEFNRLVLTFLDG